MNYTTNADRWFDGYKVEYYNLKERNTVSRTILLVKQGIAYKRRYDIENNYVSTIWEKCKSPPESVQTCFFPKSMATFWTSWKPMCSMNLEVVPRVATS